MKRIIWVCVLFAAVILSVIALVWIGQLKFSDDLMHETDRWAVIQDVNGDRMTVEPIADEVWSELVEMHQNGTRLFVGGVVEEYGNKWGFRFKPENVRVAQATAEGLQATIKYISENLDYWLGGWAYVSARVAEMHSP